jgi:hypothetical protein
MIAIFIVLLGLSSQPLGNIAIVKGKVKLSHQVSDHKTLTKTLPPGYCHGPVPVYPTDRIEIEAGGAVQGIYDGKLLLLFGPKSWHALEKGIFGGGQAARSLMARKQLGSDSPAKQAIRTADRLELWPPPAKTRPLIYVDSEGVFTLAWLAPERATTMTVTVTVKGQPIGRRTAPAHQTVGHPCPFGWIEDGELGLKLRHQAQEDDVTPVMIELRANTGQTRRIQCQLVSLRKARQWDSLISKLNTALDTHQAIDEPDWFEAWNDMLDNVEVAAPVLRGYWILKVWSVHPDAFVTRDAVRQLAEESELTDITTQFSK